MATDRQLVWRTTLVAKLTNQPNTRKLVALATAVVCNRDTPTQITTGAAPNTPVATTNRTARLKCSTLSDASRARKVFWTIKLAG
jgi:hypothetical protein